MLRGCTQQGQKLLRSLTKQHCQFEALIITSNPLSDIESLSASRAFRGSWDSTSSLHTSSFSALNSDQHQINLHRQTPQPSAEVQAAHFASSSSDPPDSDHPDQDAEDEQASPGEQQEGSSEQSLPAVLEEDEAAEVEPTAPRGQRAMSLPEYDAILDRWGELLQEGKLDEILDLMEYAYGGYDPLPPLEQLLAAGADDEAKAERRAREQALQEDFARQRVQVIDDLGRSYATGKRKTSIARVWLKPGTGVISVNSKGFDAIFPTIERRQDVLAPFAVTGTYGSYDVKATVRGGGVTGQAQALRHGIGKALQLYDPSLRPPLKTAGYLMRDARVVERKKPGRAKARKSFQWVKR